MGSKEGVKVLAQFVGGAQLRGGGIYESQSYRTHQDCYGVMFLGVAFAQSGAIAQQSSDMEKVKAASQAFYAALNARDPSAMAKVYAHTPYVAYIPR